MKMKIKKAIKRKRYIPTLQRLIVGEWYQVDCYIFQYAGKKRRQDLVKVRDGSIDPDDDYDWCWRISVNHTGCLRSWGDFSPAGWLWKSEIAGCEHLPNYFLPINYQSNDKLSS